jgi:hypothetical protein
MSEWMKLHWPRTFIISFLPSFLPFQRDILWKFPIQGDDKLPWRIPIYDDGAAADGLSSSWMNV